MSEQRRRPEKEEEKKEKEEEKKHEKQMDEKWRRDPVRGITIAIILIWGGIVALIETGDWIVSDYWQAWPAFLAGTGVILILKPLIRLIPVNRKPIGGTLVIGVVLLGVGLGFIIGWTYIWPVILIAIGIIIMTAVFFRRRQ